MPDLVAQTWATPGLYWLMLTIGVAGLVRGFAGFGTALIFVPVAGVFLPPEKVIAVIALTGLASSAAVLPRAWRQGDRREVGLLAGAAVVTVPLGLYILQHLDAVTVRWIVAVFAAGTWIALVTGWRFSGNVKTPMLCAIGGAAGLMGGMTGLTGPVVIMFYLAGQAVAQTVRANTILFLAALDVVLVGNLLFKDAFGFGEIALALALAVPYLITTLIGQALFSPSYEQLYRRVAYAVIGLAVVSGLPIWS